MIQHIFFDLDNTLWDHRKNAKLTLAELFKVEEIKEKYQIDFEDFHNQYYIINEDLWAKIRDAQIDKDYLRKHRFYDTFRAFGIDDFALSQKFEKHFLDQVLSFNELVEGAADLLDYLHQKGYILHILSNGFSEVTHRKCELSGIKNFFKTITSADEISIRKPNVEIFQYALDKAKAEKEECIMIGDDWVADAVGATHFGMKTIFFDVFNEIENHPEIRVIKKLLEIKNIL